MSALSGIVTQHLSDVITFLLVFGRTSGLMVTAPFWSSRAVPVAIRVWLAMLLAAATWPAASAITGAAEMTLFGLFLSLAGELFLGLMLGWLAQLLFAAVRLAGQQIEIRSGLGLIQLVDPQEGGQTGVFSMFLEVMAGLIFFSLNGHHLMYQALSSSYQVFPLAGEKFLLRVIDGLVSSSAEIFIIALKLSAPVLIGLLLSDIALGMVSRAIPQMNVFLVAQPLQFGFAVLLLLLSLPALVWLMVNQVPKMIGVPGGLG
jgi:flagellar biosynthetic protein FliR